MTQQNPQVSGGSINEMAVQMSRPNVSLQGHLVTRMVPDDRLLLRFLVLLQSRSTTLERIRILISEHLLEAVSASGT